MTPTVAALRAASLITRYGMSVSINGGASVLAIVDENPETIARSVPQDIYDSINGRPAFFHFAGTQAVQANDVIVYDGQSWTVHPVRVTAAGGVDVMRTVLATAGAVR